MNLSIARIALFLFFSSFLSSIGGFAQYLHREGQKIVDGSGQEVILRGMGLGGWMLQEGYMLETNAFANPQHQIRAKIEEVIGEANTNEFYDAWLANHCTKRDIDSLASWGFNSVRLPMHYNLYTPPIQDEVPGQITWLEKGFAMTDSLLAWCEANNMYLILDLHAAPGGQGNDAAISDYDKTKPSLWENEDNQKKTVALWKKLAERYANEKWIGGYDLINEPNWNFTVGANINGCAESTNAPLRKLYEEITDAIREVDQNHMIFIEGNCWGNNHNGLLPLWDNNMVISFHKYWNYNDQGSVQGFVNTRNQQNVPLWLGETGENSNVWFRNAIRLMEDNDIGWAWWPLKKVGSVVNPLTVVRNEGYAQLLNYWKNGGTKPSVDVAKASLMQLAENLKIENTIYRKDVIDAMFRQVYDDNTIPFRNHVAPGVVHASDYDLGRSGKAYFDKDSANYHVSTGSYTAWNNGWAYRNDGVDIEANNDSDTDANGYNVGWTIDNEWLQYTVNVDSSAAYNITVRHAGSGSKIKIIVDGVERSGVTELPAATGWSNYVINDVILEKGLRKIRVFFTKGGANLGNLKFLLSKVIKDVPLKAVGFQTEPDGFELRVSLNKTVDPLTVTNTGLSVTINNTPATIVNVTPTNDNNGLLIKVDKELIFSDVIKLSYNSDAIKGNDGTLLEDFSDLQASNTLPVYVALPTQIEAENFIFNQGLQLETTTDVGGGQNVGYTNVGDYLDYRISVELEGQYKIEVRIASAGSAGKLEFQQLSKTGELLNSATVDIPVTGGWQTWQTVSTTMTLDKGLGLLRAKINAPEFNINWFKFSREVINGAEQKQQQGILNIYPNPTNKILNTELPENSYRKENALCIRLANGTLVKKIERASRDEIHSINIDGFAAGLYIIEFEVKGHSWNNKFFVK